MYRCQCGNVLGVQRDGGDLVQIGSALFAHRITPSCLPCFHLYLAQGKSRREALWLSRMLPWRPAPPASNPLEDAA